MSAIFGIINKNGAPVSEQEASRMQQAMLHRATDGQRTLLSGNCFLGHHLLVVSPHQKVESLHEEGNLVITADARIDNRDELIKLLGLSNNQPTADGRLILEAYRKWGRDCVQHLEGEFAFAIFDRHAGTLFCATDHIGFRPLYYYDTPGSFVFCSEMKGILAVKQTPNIFNEEALIEYFFRQSDYAKTYNDEIFALLAGSTLTITDGKVSISKYWSPQPWGKYHFTRDKEWAECLRDVLLKAIENRMQTELPVGILLSGGLDSSSIACIAGRILEKKNRPLYAFSSVLPASHTGIEQDERKYIGIVGKHLPNLEQVFIEAPDVGPLSNLETTFGLEETIPNAFFYMDQALHEAAQKKNVRVLLSGFGGDFFVSHRGRYVLYQLIRQLKLKDAARVLRETKKFEKSYLQILKTDYVAFTKLYKYYYKAMNMFRFNWQHYTPLKDSFSKSYTQKIDFAHPSDQGTFMRQYINTGHMGRLMCTFYNRFAAYNMEAETPMFDKNVMDFMMDLPIDQLKTGGVKRSLIRRAMEGILPGEIQWRPDKTPFSPDYVARIIREKDAIRSLLNTPENAIEWKYIDKARILGHFDSLKPHTGMTDTKEIAAIRISQAVISIRFIQWLREQGYSFTKYLH